MTSHQLHVEVDPASCQGHGRCYEICPEAFQADEYGYSAVRLPVAGDDLREQLKLAADNCPERAISVRPVSD